MNCQETQETLPLLLYGELTAAEQSACDEHLAECAKCREAREQIEQLHQALAQRQEIEPSASLLAESRLRLEAAIDDQQHGWRALWHNGFPLLRFEPASGFALALTFILFGFGIGWELRPPVSRIAPEVPGIVHSGVDESGLGDTRITGISQVSPDPKTGGVKITMDAEHRVTLEGSLDDPKIQQVLVYAVKSYDNPGIRRDTLDALRSHSDNPNIRQALIYAMQHDPNAGVRMEALGAVCNMNSGEDVQPALLDTLEHDSNAGMRVAAVDALVNRTEADGCNVTTEQALQHLATTDNNPYVRLKCANAVMKLQK